MRSVTISNLAVLASSLLVKEVFAGRYDVRKRDMYLDVDSVIVTEEVVVTDMGDGTYETGIASAVGTSIIDGTPVLMTTSVSTTAIPTPSSSVAAPAITSSSSSSAKVAVFIQQSSSSKSHSSKKPATTSTTPIVQAPVATVAPTTVALVVAPIVTPTPEPTTLVTKASTTSSAAPVATAVSTSGKRGLAYNDASLLSSFVGSSAVSWCYNWGSSTSTVPSNFEYIPMLWGLGSHASDWTTRADAAIASGSTALLAFNEPDLAAQANIGYVDAAAGYLQYMQPYAGKAKLVSPAVTNGGSPMGLTWMSNFISACSTCTIDAVAIHWYNGGDAAAFKEYVAKAYTAAGNRPLWITEFQASGSVAEQTAFLAEVMPWLDSQSYVEKYAYFMVSDGNLVSGTGMSTLGKAFAG